ncbi:MAG: ferritin family protein [Deltaproteobacteria bacterium]|nr:ferritin family protein [Deltaproteobacteria bacterium]
MDEAQQRTIDMVQTALEMEEKGKAFYDKAITECSNELGNDIFTKLRDDELVHVERIKDIVADLTGGKGWTDSWKTHQPDHEDLGTVFRQLAEKHGKNIVASTGDIEALAVGIDFEQKTVTFYQEALARAEDVMERAFVEQMIEEEKGHHRVLSDMKLYLEHPETWFSEHEHQHLDGA